MGRPKGYSPGKLRLVDRQVGEWSWNSQRLNSKIQKSTDDECWTWTGSRGPQGNLFGAYKNNKQQMTQANRLIYAEHTNKPIEGQQVRMACYNKTCCNPHHMTVGPQPYKPRDKKPKLKTTKTVIVSIGFEQQNRLTAEQKFLAGIMLQECEILDQGIDIEFNTKWFKVNAEDWALAAIKQHQLTELFTVKQG